MDQLLVGLCPAGGNKGLNPAAGVEVGLDPAAGVEEGLDPGGGYERLGPASGGDEGMAVALVTLASFRALENLSIRSKKW